MSVWSSVTDKPQFKSYVPNPNSSDIKSQILTISSRIDYWLVSIFARSLITASLRTMNTGRGLLCNGALHVRFPSGSRYSLSGRLPNGISFLKMRKIRQMFSRYWHGRITLISLSPSIALYHILCPFLSYRCCCMQAGGLSLIHIWRCRRSYACRSRWSPYH